MKMEKVLRSALLLLLAAALIFGMLPYSAAAGKETPCEVVEQTVKVGINNRVNAEILSGLNKGDEVILSEEGPDSGKGSKGGRGGRPF